MSTAANSSEPTVKRVTSVPRNDAQEEFSRASNAPPLPGILEFAAAARAVQDAEAASKKVATVEKSPRLKPNDPSKAVPSSFVPPPKHVHDNSKTNPVINHRVSQPRSQNH